MSIFRSIKTQILKAGNDLRGLIASRSLHKNESQAELDNSLSEEQLTQDQADQTAGSIGRWKKVSMIAGLAVVIAGGGTYYAVERHIEQDRIANTHILYEVILNGEKLGLVSDPQVLEDYILDRYTQVQTQHTGIQMELEYGEVTFREQAIYKGEAADAEVLAMLEPQIRSYAVAVELRIDGELIGYVKDQATADRLLEQVKQPYDEPVTTSRNGEVQIASAADPESDETRRTLAKQVTFVEEVVQQTVELQPDQLSDPGELLERIQSGGVEPLSYVVREGDTIYDIAKKYNISSEVIYRNNTWIRNDLLHPGDVLNLTVWQPLLSVQVTQTIEQKEEIPFPIEYVSDPDMLEGQTKVITSGIAGERVVTIEETTINGMLASSHEIESIVTKEPVAATYLRGTKSVSGLDQLVQKLLGIPYVWGGTTTAGFDCSGFTKYVLGKYGVDLPRTSASQAEAGTQVAKKDLRKGDLVFFHTFGPSGTISHVAIYMGNGKIANALSSKVQINDLNDDYFSKRYITSRRVLSDEQYQALSK